LPSKLLLEVTKLIVEPFGFAHLIKGGNSQWYQALGIIIAVIILCGGLIGFLFIINQQVLGILFGLIFLILLALIVTHKRTKD
jgi:hypothetical protein